MNKYKYRTISVYVDTEVDIPMDEVMIRLDTDDLIEELLDRNISPQEKTKLIGGFGTEIKTDGTEWTLYDDLKMDVIREAFNKYTLEELEERLK